MIALTILKVIGIILLITVAIILLVALLILFMPLRYKAAGDIDNCIIGMGRVTWLFRLFEVGFKYNEESEAYYRIFFWKRPMFDDDDVDEDENENENVRDDIDDSYMNGADAAEAAKAVEEVEGLQESLDLGQELEQAKGLEHSEEAKTSKKKYRTKKKIDLSFFSRIKALWIKIQKIKNNKIYNRAYNHIKDELFILLKAIAPKRLKLDLDFSTGSPDTTGQALGVIAMFPMVYKNKWNICPDFQADSPYARGSFDVTGRIYGYKLIFIIIRLLVDKNCRKLYNDFKK